MEQELKAIGRRIEEAAAAKGISWRQLAKDAKVGEEAITRARKGTGGLGAKRGPRVAAALGVSYDWLLTGERGEPKPPPPRQQLDAEDRAMLTLYRELRDQAPALAAAVTVRAARLLRRAPDLAEALAAAVTALEESVVRRRQATTRQRRRTDRKRKAGGTE